MRGRELPRGGRHGALAGRGAAARPGAAARVLQRGQEGQEAQGLVRDGRGGLGDRLGRQWLPLLPPGGRGPRGQADREEQRLEALDRLAVREHRLRGAWDGVERLHVAELGDPRDALLHEGPGVLGGPAGREGGDSETVHLGPPGEEPREAEVDGALDGEDGVHQGGEGLGGVAGVDEGLGAAVDVDAEVEDEPVQTLRGRGRVERGPELPQGGQVPGQGGGQREPRVLVLQGRHPAQRHAGPRAHRGGQAVLPGELLGRRPRQQPPVGQDAVKARRRGQVVLPLREHRVAERQHHREPVVIGQLVHVVLDRVRDPPLHLEPAPRHFPGQELRLERLRLEGGEDVVAPSAGARGTDAGGSAAGDRKGTVSPGRRRGFRERTRGRAGAAECSAGAAGEGAWAGRGAAGGCSPRADPGPARGSGGGPSAWTRDWVLRGVGTEAPGRMSGAGFDMHVDP